MTDTNGRPVARRLLCIGNPLIELHAEVPPSLLQQFGLRPNAAVQVEEKHKGLLGELLRLAEPQSGSAGLVDYAAGGSAATTAIVAAGLLRSGTAEHETESAQSQPLVSFLGGVGHDQLGSRLREQLEAEGVAPLFSDSDAEVTGWRAVLMVQAQSVGAISPGRDALVGLALGEVGESSHARRAGGVTHATYTGAAREYKLDHLRFKVWDMVEAARVVYVDSLFLTVSVESVKYVAEHCAKMGNIFCLNLAASHLCRYFHDRILTLLPFTDYVFGNESEYLALADHRKEEAGKDIDSVVTWLAKLSRVDGDLNKRRHIIVTCGQQPTIVASTWRGYGVKVRRYQVPPVKAGRYVSKDGAGDAFAGGFLFALLHEADLDTCVLHGHYAARVAVQRTGPRFNFSDRPAISTERHFEA